VAGLLSLLLRRVEKFLGITPAKTLNMNDITEHEFELEGEFIELIKLLKITGLCQTGGHAKMVVSEGRVKVDSESELRKKRKVRKGQTVEFENHRIRVV